MKPRGVTLVELLAAISILVVVTALSLPAIENRMAGARLEAAQGQIEAAVLAVRAEAARAGKMLVLSARTGRTREVELVVTRLEASTREEGRGREEEKGTLAAGTVWCTLPGGIRVSQRARVEGVEAEPVRKAAAGAQGIEEVRLALFCPDGTAIPETPRYLGDESGDYSIAIQAWVGGANFALYVPPAEGGTEDDRPAPAATGREP